MLFTAAPTELLNPLFFSASSNFHFTSSLRAKDGTDVIFCGYGVTHMDELEGTTCDLIGAWTTLLIARSLLASSANQAPSTCSFSAVQ